MSVCEIRHIQRCRPDDPGAITVGRVHFRAAALEGVNGEGGWISAEVNRVLSDDGSLLIRFANGTGGDGVPHRERFAILTQDAYKIGDEWIEVRREAGKLMAVCSPASWEINGNEIVLTCTDVLALTTLTREETLHPWCAPPRDVVDYYGRLEVPHVMRSFLGWSYTGNGTTPDGWGYYDVGVDPAGVRIDAGGYLALDPPSVPAAIGEAWSAQVTGKFLANGNDIWFSAFGNLLILTADGAAFLEIDSLNGVLHRRTDVGPNKAFSLRLYRRGEWIFAQVNGETIEIRRSNTMDEQVGVLSLGGGAVISQLTSSTMERFLGGANEPGDRHLPGVPTAGGLAGRYFLESDAKACCAPVYDYSLFARMHLHPLQDEYPGGNRTDPTINFAAADPPTWQPPGPAGGTWWSARWTGAIKLDLATSDRNLQTVLGAGDNARIWVGKRGPNEAPFFSPNAGTATSGGLRAHLGSVSGWYPIIIEYRHSHSTAGMILRDGAAGSYAVVPAERLSPYGVFEDKVQHESHRSMIDRITQEFGYQWTIQPRSLESGSFPGRLVPRVRQGSDRNVRLRDADATTSGLRSSGNAADSAVRLLIDAAGLAAPGGGSTTAEAWDINAAVDALYVATAWEGAPEITDPGLALQRAESLLALHAGPTQTVSANPSGDRTLTDTWPLTGALSRIEWEPGDAPMLDFPNIAVVDRTPRQLTAVTWPCRPNGVGVPEATWLNKPKGKRTIARRALQAASAAQRNYQGQRAVLSGAMGGSNTSLAPDAYTRLFADPARIVMLGVAADGVFSGTLEVNGTNTGLVISAPTLQPVDVTPWIRVAGQQYARFLSATGTYTIQLVATVTL